MKQKLRHKPPEIVFHKGEPTAVILDIETYREMLERLDDQDDLKLLEEMRKKPLKFKDLGDFLKEYNPGV
ncbi:MAG: type II toxin-antitoxin system Phd/YefM family antitoxin [Candidatus Wallbacteria bacterium]|nr:type II toxin-antitoxin system Phd/YefM family antitoxin [Candidatus Wallbacteria bacterium]